MVITKALTMVAAHGKQLLQHLVNIGQKKKLDHLALMQMAQILDHNTQFKKLPNATQYRNK